MVALTICVVLIIVNQLIRLVEDQYYFTIKSSILFFCPYLKNFEIPLSNQYLIFCVYLVLLFILHEYKGKLHDFRLETGKWLFTAGLLGNGISWLVYKNVIDYIGIPSIGVATNLPDIAIFAGFVFYSFGLSREVVHYYLPRWKRGKYINNDHGFVLVSTVSFVIILLLLAMAVLGLANNQARMAVAYRDSNAALYVAESGINATLYKLENNDLSFTEDEDGIFKAGFSYGADVFTDGSSFDVSVIREDAVDNAGNSIYKYTITSTGKKNGRNRTVVIYAKSSTRQEQDDSDDGDDEKKRVKLVVNGPIGLNSANAFQLKGEAHVYVNGKFELNGASIDISNQSNINIYGDFANNGGSVCNISNKSEYPVNFYVQGKASFYNGSKFNTDGISTPNGRVNLFVRGDVATSSSPLSTSFPDRMLLLLPNKDESNNDLSHYLGLWGSATIKAGIYAPSSEVASGNNLIGAVVCKKNSWNSGTKTFSPLMSELKHEGNLVFPNNNTNKVIIETISPPFNLKYNMEPMPTYTIPPISNNTLHKWDGDTEIWESGEYNYKTLTLSNGSKLIINGPANLYVNDLQLNGSILETYNDVNIYIKNKLQLNSPSTFRIVDSGIIYVGSKIEVNSSWFIYEGASGDGDGGNSGDEITVPSWDISWEEE